jgi:hypothetical protein
MHTMLCISTRNCCAAPHGCPYAATTAHASCVYVHVVHNNAFHHAAMGLHNLQHAMPACGILVECVVEEQNNEVQCCDNVFMAHSSTVQQCYNCTATPCCPAGTASMPFDTCRCSLIALEVESNSRDETATCT